MAINDRGEKIRQLLFTDEELEMITDLIGDYEDKCLKNLLSLNYPQNAAPPAQSLVKRQAAGLCRIIQTCLVILNKIHRIKEQEKENG